MPAGTTYARFSLFDADVDPGDDLDLYVYKGATLVGVSGGGTSAEEVNLVNPAAGTYTVCVHGFGVPAARPPYFTLFTLGARLRTAAGNMTVTRRRRPRLGAPARSARRSPASRRHEVPRLRRLRRRRRDAEPDDRPGRHAVAS